MIEYRLDCLILIPSYLMIILKELLWGVSFVVHLIHYLLLAYTSKNELKKSITQIKNKTENNNEILILVVIIEIFSNNPS